MKFSHWLPRLLQVEAITIYPYVFYNDDEDFYLGKWGAPVIKHELAHVSQVIKYGWFRFYISYLLYYLAERVKGEDHFEAYLNIPYEIEARKAELDV